MTEVMLDTSVILRFLTNDPPEVASRVDRLLRQAETGALKLRLHAVVVQEVVWVLESFYRLDRSAIQERLQALLDTRNVELEGKEIASEALDVYRRRRVEFTDAFLASYMRAKGLRRIASLDRRFLKRIPWIEGAEF